MENDKEFIQRYFAEMREVLENISVEDIEKTITLLFEAWENKSNVFLCGNGGSASTATHFACDLLKSTASGDKRGLKAESLNDNVPLLTALINDEGFDSLFIEQLRTRFQKGDVLICISVHGGAGKDKASLWSQNLLKAMMYVKENGGKTIGFSGFNGGPMKDVADVCVVVPINSTPHVESFHVVLEHLICSRLKEKIAESSL